MALTDQRDTLGLTEPGWYPDPAGEHHLRYFNGTGWTSHVTHYGPTPCRGCSHTPATG